MAYQGDIKAARVLRFTFTTVTTTGAPTVLAGTPAVSVYKDASVTQSTTGVTLTVDYDGVVGLNHVAIDTSADGTFYSAGSDFAVIITTGTVGGTSVVGYVVGSFSIENRVVNWAQIGSPTTTQNLSGTTIATTQKVDVETIKTNPVVNAGTITFPTTATLASTTNITAASGVTLTATTGLGNQTANITGNLSGSVGSVTGAVGSVTGAVGSVTGAVGSVTGSVGSVTGLTASNLDAAISTRATPAQILTTALTESYAANGIAPTLTQALYAVHQYLMQFGIATTNYTVKKLDNSTTAFVVTLDDSVTPTAAART